MKNKIAFQRLTTFTLNVPGRVVLYRYAVAAALLVGGVQTTWAANKTFTGPGNFSDAAKWGGTLPGANDTLRINGICTNDNAAANLAYGTIEVGRGVAGTLVWPVGGTNTLRVTGIVASSNGGTIDMSNGGTISIGANNWITTGQTFIPGAGTIIWADTGGGSTLPAAITAYNNLNIATVNRVATLGVSVTINGDLSLTSGTLAASTFSIAVKGSWFDNGGTFTPGTGSVVLNGTGSQTIGGSSSTTFNQLAISNVSASVSVAANINVSGTLSVGPGAVVIPDAAMTINTTAAGTLTGAGTIKVTRTAATADLLNQYKFTTYSLSGLTVDYAGEGSQTVNSTLGAYSALTLSGSGTKTLQAAVTNNGALTIGSGVTLADGGFTLTAKGNVANTGTHSGAGKVLLAGSAAQTLSGSGSYGNLEVNNAAGVSLAGSPAVAGVLTLTAGQIVTGAQRLDLGAGATVVRSGGWVNGTLQKALNTGSGQTFIFPIGGSVYYRPVAVSNLNVTATGTLSAFVTASIGNHPQIATSGLNPDKTVLRYWTLTAGSGLAVANYDATFTFVSSDVSPGADTSRFDVRKWDGSAWDETSDGVPPSATSTTATGLSSFSDFAIGEPQASLMLVTLPGQTFTSGAGNTGSPDVRTAGAPFNLTLSAIGVFTNVDTSYSGLKTIHYSGPTNAPDGTAPAYPVSVLFVNGQATVEGVVLPKAETVTLSATDALLTPVPSAPVTVAPAAANRLAFLNEPVTVTAGTASTNLTVQRQDAYGNPNTSDATRSVTLTSDSAGSVTFAPASPVSITSGASSVSFTYTDAKAGTPTVTASSTSPTMSATQKQTILAGPVSASQSTLTASPSSVLADGTTASTLTVTLKDSQGNLVPNKSVSLLKTQGQGNPVITTLQNVTGTNGVGSWTVRSTTAETVTFAARDTTEDILVSQTASVTFTPGTVHHYKVTFSAAPYYALTPFNTVITARDVYDNFVSSDNGTLFSLSGSCSTLVWDGSGDGAFSTDAVDLEVSTVNGTASIPTKCLAAEGDKGVVLVASNTVTHLTYSSLPIDLDVQTDAYRTRASGLWYDVSTWERYDSSVGVSNWVLATHAPAYTNGVISILPAHAVTVTADMLVDQVHVESGGQLAVVSGVTLTVTNAALPGLEVYGTLLNTGAVNVAVCSNSVLVVYDSGVLGNAGSVSSCSNSLVFYGGTYQHLHSTSAGTIPAATWGANSQLSTCAILGYTGNTGTPGGLGQRFQNFIWNCPDQTGAISLGTGFVGVVTFDLSGTGSGRISLATGLGVTNTLTVSGGSTLYCGTNIVSADRFDLQNGNTLGIGAPDGITTNGTSGNIRSVTRHFSSGANYVYNGTAAQTTGDALPARAHRLTVDNTAGVTLSQDLTVNDQLTLENGALAIGGHQLTLENALTRVNGSLTGGGTSALSITDLGGAANVSLPAVASGLQSLTLARDSGATLTGAVTVWNTITLTNGVLSGAGNLTLAHGCHFIRSTGTFYGPGLPTLLGLLDVTFLSGDLTAGLAFPPAVSNLIRNVTLANTTGTILLNYDFILQGNLTVKPGARVNDSGHTVTVHGSMTNSGTYVSSGGRLILAGGTNLHVIAGGGTYDNLELNDPLGATLDAPATVQTKLTLTAGTLVNSDKLTLGSNADILRAAGALDAAPTFGTTVNVTYFGTAGVTTGFELPAADGVLVNLTLNHSAAATVTLDDSRTVYGDLSIGSHSALADNGYLLGVYNDVRNDGTHSGTGEIRLFNPASQVLYGSGRYGNLVLLKGSVYLAGDPTIDGLLTINLMRDVSPFEFVVGAHTLTLNGPAIAANPTDLVTSLESSLVFGGSATNVVLPASVEELNNLTINNTNGVSVSHMLRVVGTLTLTDGVLNTGTNIVHLNNPGNESLVHGNGWINGPLCKLFNVGTGQAFTYWIGDATTCRPIACTDLNILQEGEMRLEFVQGLHPQASTSGLNPAKTLPFDIRRTSVGRLAIGGLQATVNFVEKDVSDLGADASRFVDRSWSSDLTKWLNLTVTGHTASSITVFGLARQPMSANDSYNDFLIGEPLASQLVATLPGETYVSGSGKTGAASVQTAGAAFDLKLSAVDLFGVVDASYSGAKTISYSGPGHAPNGQAPVYTTDVTFSSGQALAATTLKRAETTAITATESGLGSGTSADLTVGAGSASQLVFTSAPVTANTSVASSPITVERRDAYGNPNTADAALTLTLSSTSGGTTSFSPASPQIAVGNSSVSFTYADSQAGTPTVTAHSGTLTDATQQETVVTPSSQTVSEPGNLLPEGGTPLLPGDSLVFSGGSSAVAVNNNYEPYTLFGGITFASSASAFTLAGNPLALSGNIIDSATTLQTILTDLELTTETTVEVGTNGLLVIEGEISGDYGLTKTETGVLALTGANTYSGGTIVSGGKLLVNNTQGSATGSGTVTVNSGGTLGGGGFISGAVTIQAGGTLAPGNSPGTITFYDNLTLTSGSTFAVEIGGVSNDLAVVSGTASLGGATLSITGSAPTTNSFTIISAGSVTGTFAGLAEGASVQIDGKLYFIHYGETEVTLNASARLTGYVFRDKSSPLDGIFNSGDSAVSNAVVRLFTNGVEAASYTTGYYGYYEFAGLLPGAATLKIALDSGTLTTGVGGSDPMRNQAVVEGSDAVITTTVVSGAGVLSTPDTLNFGFDVKPLSTALDIGVFATADGVVIELWTVDESGYDDIVIYAWIGGDWVEVGRVPSAEVIGEGSNRYQVRASGLAATGAYAFKIIDEAGHVHVTAAPVAVQSIRVAAVRLELETLTLTFNTEYGSSYTVETSADLVNWTPETVSVSRDTGWTAYGNTAFAAGTGSQTLVRVPRHARDKAFFRIVRGE